MQNQLNNPRAELEKDLVFEGFEVFENRLKLETKGAIAELRDS
jgi:magnesium-transporting ATPase (P-type)